MNIIKSPQALTPAYNPVIYQFGSTFSNILYFDIKVYDVSSNSIIINDKTYVTPINVSGSDYNISDIARNLVKWQIINDDVFIRPITESIRDIQLKVTEKGLIGITMSSLASETTLNSFKIWNGKLNRLEYSGYTQSTYLLSSTISNIKFLTKRPNYTEVNDLSRDYLYFIKTPSYQPFVTLSILSVTGSVVSSTQSQVVGTSSMYRIDVSPQVIKSTYPTLLTTYSKYYVVLKDSNGTEVSERKYFNYKEQPCNVELVNILWENQLGGIDSYQFINPIETSDVERTTIEKNPYSYDDNNNYVDFENNIYNQQERIINVRTTTTIKCWTKTLTDSENDWLSDLLVSRNVWVELNNKTIYPVSIQETSYTINRKRYVRNEPLISQWTFKIVGDIVNREDLIQG